jgi:SulP family sulfate permease
MEPSPVTSLPKLPSQVFQSSLSRPDVGASERTPLLSQNNHAVGGDPESGLILAHTPSSSSPHKSKPTLVSKAVASTRTLFSPSSIKQTSSLALAALPAVLLGCLLNILDALSYGMLIFPASPPFTGVRVSTDSIGSTMHSTMQSTLEGTPETVNLIPAGVSMFFVSALVAQVVYSAGGSGFAGANGSMMIEVVPFFHIIANGIVDGINAEFEATCSAGSVVGSVAHALCGGRNKDAEIVATTLAAYALSSLLTGLAFLLLGHLKLGRLIGFFPRHILVGCIGGVGVFLLITGFTVTTRMSEDDFSFSIPVLKTFMEAKNFMLWAPALVLAVGVRLITAKWNKQLIFPAYFLAIPVLFYAVVLVLPSSTGVTLSTLREHGFLFDTPPAGAWYAFYGYFRPSLIRPRVLLSTLPTQLALLFFNVLHPPLNVPALAVSLDQDVDTNRELVGHGFSNLISACVGSVPNYLVYVNTLLFYRVGGVPIAPSTGKESRIAGWLLALATLGLLVAGTGMVRYIPVLVVGALIFVLGLDLVREAVWDVRGRVSRSEFVTIISIMVVMTGWDFVAGVGFGVVMSCEYRLLTFDLTFSTLCMFHMLSLIGNRRVLCGPKFEEDEYTGDIYGRSGDVNCTEAECSSCVPQGGVQTDDSITTSGYDLTRLSSMLTCSSSSCFQATSSSAPSPPSKTPSGSSSHPPPGSGTPCVSCCSTSPSYLG